MSKIKIIGWCIGIVLVVFLATTIGASFYMLNYSLSPDPKRADTAFCYREQFATYPETRPLIVSDRAVYLAKNS